MARYFADGDPVVGPEQITTGAGAVVFFDDFTRASLSASTDVSDWDCLGTNSGTFTLDEGTLAGGWMKLTTGTIIGNETSAQANGAAFLLAQGKQLYMETSLYIADVDRAAFFAGIGIPGDDQLVDGATDLLGIRMLDGTASVVPNFVSEKDSTETTLSTGVTLADSTAVKFGMAWDGVSTVTCYANNERVGTITTNICDDASLTPSFEVLAKHGSAQSLYVDYILVRQER